MKHNGRSGGERARVEAARRQAAVALGRDPDGRDPFVEPPKSGSTASSTTLVSPPVASHAIGVLTIAEAAARLGMSRTRLETLVDRGLVEALQTGFTRTIPTSEVERLHRADCSGS